MTSVSEESAHARNRFENRRLRKTMEHIAFTHRYAQNRLDDEIRVVRDNLRDIRLNTGHSSTMDAEGVRNFCRGKYTGSHQRRAAELVERGEQIDWSLTVDRRADSVRVPDLLRQQTSRRHASRAAASGLRRSASLTARSSSSSRENGVPHEGDEGPIKRAASFNQVNSTTRPSLRTKRRPPDQQQQQHVTMMDGKLPQANVKRSESFHSTTSSRPSSRLQRSSSVHTSISRTSSLSQLVDRAGTASVLRQENATDGPPPPTKSVPTKLPSISKGSLLQVPSDEVSKSPRRRATGSPRSPRLLCKKNSRRRKSHQKSTCNDIDLTDLVQEIVMDAEAQTKTETSDGLPRQKRKPFKKPPRPTLAWPPNAPTSVSLPAVAGAELRVQSSASCPLPEGHKADKRKDKLRKLSCPDEDDQSKARILTERDSEVDDDDDGDYEDDAVFVCSDETALALAGAGGEEIDEPEVMLSPHARRKKVLNARAVNTGMSLAELITKRQGDIKIAMSPRQLRRIREQIILQRTRRDYTPTAGEQARFRQIEDRVRSFLEQEIVGSEWGSGTDSYNSEEEGSLV